VPSAAVRVQSIVAGTSSTFTHKMQAMVEQAATSTRAAVLDEQLPEVLVALLTPASMVVLVFALWRFSSDIGWTEAFPIASGFFSHWQVWIALAILLRFGAAYLQRRPRVNSKTSQES
jgi:hypothetical protein